MGLGRCPLRCASIHDHPNEHFGSADDDVVFDDFSKVRISDSLLERFEWVRRGVDAYALRDCSGSGDEEVEVRGSRFGSFRIASVDDADALDRDIVEYLFDMRMLFEKRKCLVVFCEEQVAPAGSLERVDPVASACV